MQVCILYASRNRESDKLKAIADSLAKGISAQGHIPTEVSRKRDSEVRSRTYWPYRPY